MPDFAGIMHNPVCVAFLAMAFLVTILLKHRKPGDNSQSLVRVVVVPVVVVPVAERSRRLSKAWKIAIGAGLAVGALGIVGALAAGAPVVALTLLATVVIGGATVLVALLAA